MFTNAFVAIALFLFLSSSIRLLLEASFMRKALGLALLGHAINVLLLLSGMTSPQDKVLGTASFAQAGRFELMVDPLPQALILTAIIIGFSVLTLFLVYEFAVLKTRITKGDL